MEMGGPRDQGPPIVIAGGKPKMLRLAARFGDEWNWWAHGKALIESVRPITEELDQACAEVGRDPATLRRSLDVYSVDPLGIGFDPEAHMVQIGGPTGEIADALLESTREGLKTRFRLSRRWPPSSTDYTTPDPVPPDQLRVATSEMGTFPASACDTGQPSLAVRASS